ncbi:MAG: hypothetical protein EXQ63_04550 [Ilumatobacteraceae bacterium]|nr:hypothetical protein [Ilumatobacteraceae bacterium]
MTLRLTVHQARWKEHVQATALQFAGLVPVIKGNGYGLRRWNLMPLASELSSEIAVGTVYEVRDIPPGVTPMVLTPIMSAPPNTMPVSTVLTIGRLEHIMALSHFQWTGNVVVKLQSSMLRYGTTKEKLADLLAEARSAHLNVVGFSIHPPLDGEMQMHVKDIENWLEHIDSALPIYISHVNASAVRQLRKYHPQYEFKIRLGTELWLGDKSMMQLSADVLDRHSVESSQTVGYRQQKVSGMGEIVLVGAGSAHGVAPLDDGRSPFHFQKQRINLHEAPHMHTSMLFIARGRLVPSIGEWIDVQRPLTQVQVDVLQWAK